MIKKLLAIIKNDNFLSLFGQVSFAVLSFGSVSFLARSFSVGDFGEWALYLAAIAFFEMIRFGIIRTPLVRFLAAAETNEEKEELIGSSWILGLIVTVILILIVSLSYLIFEKEISESGFQLFFIWYPLFSIVTLPFNNGLSILQAGQNFLDLMYLKVIGMGSFFLFIFLNYLFFRLELKYIVYANIASYGISSIYGIIRGWTGLKFMIKAKTKTILEQFNFGKFSLLTFLGGNLLKSSDTFILGIMMSKADVAFYAIPLKLIEVIEIPIRSFVNVALPRMAKASRTSKDEVRGIFYTYSGILSMLFLPLLTLLFIFAKPLVWIVAGDAYIADGVPSIAIFRIFLIYGFFLTIDRFTGVTLDSINKPKFNSIKVLLMASVNIIGDIIAIYYFESLHAVAFVTIINSMLGVYVGTRFLKKEINLNIFKIPVIGIKIIKSKGLKHIFNK
ncbi:MAG: oligosaccharide flippase family protein [Bacteroidetes bacterium]|jgi:O-antigen/teichoic acid export membrane protein|nr:oligosaccharide flippase family protein [Bacteroidota bacterium]MBT6685480.1 oligosaccharide flippase family protein [Bacteroidota bacterium]MBT7143741.1 oligosaccharide flippase family protein [Bacteroidota bacterium]MBT7491460.1 oligosaccharide flippase family protein [Bacteroidota bacterium]